MDTSPPAPTTSTPSFLNIKRWIRFAILGFLLTNRVAAAAEPPVNNGDFLFLYLHPSISKNLFTFKPQFDLAVGAGVDRFSSSCPFFPLEQNPPPSAWVKGDALLSLFLQGSDTSQIAPRIPLMANVGNARLTDDDAIRWNNGTSKLLSWTSTRVQAAAVAAVRNIVEHCEASPAGPRIWGYHLCAEQTGEWIINGYQHHGPDCSDSSRDAFRKWLAQKYDSNKKMQAAWGNISVQRDNAKIPIDTEGRYSAHHPAKEDVVEAFYHLPQEQNWVDYSKFASDNNAECIRKLAHQVKISSHGKKKVIIFYGYVFEVFGSICGHLAAGALLNDPDIDYLAAPISYSPYSQRLTGGVGGPMSAIDSVPLHGKTWINENDLHTHAQMPEVTVPDWYWDPHTADYYVPANLVETSGILKRNLAFDAFHHSAEWWMDLIGGGWFSDPGLWDIWKGPFGASLRDIHAKAIPYSPVVAVVVDEESRFYERFTFTSFKEMYPPLRNAMMGCGTSVGFYYMQDYLAGKIPPTSATVFVNVWRLDAQRKVALKAMVKQRGGTVIWQYAPGYLDDSVQGTAGVEDLTGIHVQKDNGALGSTGIGPLAGMKFGGKTRMKPRILIDDSKATSLAKYDGGDGVSAAYKTTMGVRHVLIADCTWTARVVHAVLQQCHVPVYCDVAAVVQANQQDLYVYGTANGTAHLMAPAGTTFQNGMTAMTADLSRNESLLFPLRKAKSR